MSSGTGILEDYSGVDIFSLPLDPLSSLPYPGEESQPVWATSVSGKSLQRSYGGESDMEEFVTHFLAHGVWFDLAVTF